MIGDGHWIRWDDNNRVMENVYHSKEKLATIQLSAKFGPDQLEPREYDQDDAELNHYHLYNYNFV